VNCTLLAGLKKDKWQLWIQQIVMFAKNSTMLKSERRNSMVIGKEIEFKYLSNGVDEVSLGKFLSKNIKTEFKYIRVDGRDVFFGKKNSEFFRYRTSTDGLSQLTLKRKLCKKNNFIRIENNLDLIGHHTDAYILDFCRNLGFEYNMTLHKKAHIYKSKKYTIVYYKVYNQDDPNIGHFIEIEMAEDYPWRNQVEAYIELCRIEKKFKKLGLGPKTRVKKSLWEIYKK
jgi:adenylate cyclase class IV